MIAIRRYTYRFIPMHFTVASEPDERDTLFVTLQAPHRKRFVPGTTGWSEDDLDEPRIEARWERGGYEIVEGVLARTPAAYLQESLPLGRLVRQVERHLETNRLPGEFAFGVDLVVDPIRVARVDALLLTPEQIRKQAQIEARRKRPRPISYGRLRVAPQLIIESISIGHELHDRQTKLGWYRTFGLSHYWLLDPFRRTLDCLRLEGNDYVIDAAAAESAELTPTLFARLVLRLGEIWV
jgi:Uma2 family endonuclease